MTEPVNVGIADPGNIPPCRCGHSPGSHKEGKGRYAPAAKCRSCECPEYRASERPVFGVHRLPPGQRGLTLG